MEDPPHPLRLGDDEQAYYRGAGATTTRRDEGEVPA
jgi:hypothetical protein